MHGVLLDLDTIDRGDLELSRLGHTLSPWQQYGVTDAEQVAERIADAEVVISNKVMLDASVLDAATRLKLICVAATGTNNVDIQAARRLGISVCNVRAYATPSVVQHVFMLILALTTRLPDYQRAIRKQRWQAHPHFCLLDYPIRELAGKTLGIIGYGELGSAVARVAECFGMRVLVSQRSPADNRPGRTPLAELLQQSDVVSVHCPLTPETENLIGEAEIARMKNDAVLINAARGGIVNERALVEALAAGQLGGAGVDVLSEEPPARGNPLLDAELSNLIVTPHIAWASRESRQRLIDEVAANITAFINGTPRNQVN
jgi:glycerate dehydrogenase